MTNPFAGRYDSSPKACGLLVGMTLGMLWLAGTSTAMPPRSLLVSAEAPDVKALPQNWSDAEANWFYNLAQGSKLIPYAWFRHLEQPDAEAKFADPGHVRSLGYLPRTSDPLGNPDGLPIGFVRDGEHLGLTCAACHTGQINHNGKGWLIDGAPTLGDVERLQRRLATALAATHSDDSKFARFASGVLGSSATGPMKSELRGELKKVLTNREGYNRRNLPEANAAPFGPGRVDAFGAIMNEVTETFAQAPGNHASANAPVSYPFLWDTPQHDRVQWNGAAENKDSLLLKPIVGTVHVGALGRNAGEVMGVFGNVDASNEGSVFQLRGYLSTVNKDNLIAVEESLRKLWSPQWPVGLPPINDDLRDKGRALFKKHCQSCHDTAFRRDDPNRTLVAVMRAVGTDQTMASNFATRTAKSGILQGRYYQLTDFRKFGPDEPIKDLLVHMVQRVVVRPKSIGSADFSPDDLLVEIHLDMSYKVYAEIKLSDDRSLSGAFSGLKLQDGKVQEAISQDALRIAEGLKLFRQDIATTDDTNRFVAADGQEIRINTGLTFSKTVLASGRQVAFTDSATIQFAYKARPLNGIWATAPYLHNGSVPTLDELLKRSTQRVKKFRVGSREFDPVNVGFRIDQGTYEFDATLPGNSNAGHDFGPEFTAEERGQLVEYMKSL